MPRTALFAIDIQVELAQNAATEIPHAERIRGAGTTILQRARQAIDTACEQGREPDIEIVFVQHEESAEKGPLVKGSKAWELVFKPRDDNKWERLVEKDVPARFNVILLQGAHSTYDYNDKTAREVEIDVELMLESAGAEVEGWKVWKPVA
ncbi:uncharacterized protein J4E79_007632 [Alternaria viburni]|uniref:uncharacterized protein n=1 Tax=Alternaria viburni TaxID=566460 RepID=UPI0020C2BA98|nr:uncharacterized protein J4E79_007632 [Alternaria viburni]KAI4657017.1 hypothetical protein J4E79_007632 [Alternaria viburni]